jgi:hypothetical protein
MKYEAPEMTVLTPAINAIHGTTSSKIAPPIQLESLENEGVGAYLDWED